MLKEYNIKAYKKVCDSCGLEKDPEAFAFNSASRYAQFYTLLDKDLCDLCFHGLIEQFVKDRVLTQEIIDETLEVFIAPKRYNHGFEATSTFSPTSS